jgi:hypothetical protein
MSFYLLGEKSKRDSIVEMEYVEALLADRPKKVGQEPLIFMVRPIRIENSRMNLVIVIYDDSMQCHSIVIVPIDQGSAPGKEMNIMATASQFKRELECNAGTPTQTGMAYHGYPQECLNLQEELTCSPEV